jgi:hypothetical protein
MKPLSDTLTQTQKNLDRTPAVKFNLVAYGWPAKSTSIQQSPFDWRLVYEDTNPQHLPYQLQGTVTNADTLILYTGGEEWIYTDKFTKIPAATLYVNVSPNTTFSASDDALKPFTSNVTSYAYSWIIKRTSSALVCCYAADPNNAVVFRFWVKEGTSGEIVYYSLSTDDAVSWGAWTALPAINTYGTWYPPNFNPLLLRACFNEDGECLVVLFGESTNYLGGLCQTIKYNGSAWDASWGLGTGVDIHTINIIPQIQPNTDSGGCGGSSVYSPTPANYGMFADASICYVPLDSDETKGDWFIYIKAADRPDIPGETISRWMVYGDGNELPVNQVLNSAIGTSTKGSSIKIASNYSLINTMKTVTDVSNEPANFGRENPYSTMRAYWEMMFGQAGAAPGGATGGHLFVPSVQNDPIFQQLLRRGSTFVSQDGKITLTNVMTYPVGSVIKCPDYPMVMVTHREGYEHFLMKRQDTTLSNPVFYKGMALRYGTPLNACVSANYVWLFNSKIIWCAPLPKEWTPPTVGTGAGTSLTITKSRILRMIENSNTDAGSTLDITCDNSDNYFDSPPVVEGSSVLYRGSRVDLFLGYTVSGTDYYNGTAAPYGQYFIDTWAYTREPNRNEVVFRCKDAWALLQDYKFSHNRWYNAIQGTTEAWWLAYRTTWNDIVEDMIQCIGGTFANKSSIKLMKSVYPKIDVRTGNTAAQVLKRLLNMSPYLLKWRGNAAYLITQATTDKASYNFKFPVTA